MAFLSVLCSAVKGRSHRNKANVLSITYRMDSCTGKSVREHVHAIFVWKRLHSS